jgi:hypothetical protein
VIVPTAPSIEINANHANENSAAMLAIQNPWRSNSTGWVASTNRPSPIAAAAVHCSMRSSSALAVSPSVLGPG